ncbi:DNA-binding SARP family transcriptional activator [Asanoa ferruginea]|uniref:DNA-binding SARP family transcriptional activator n=2 Tax=Asanoa ferruginea TaxID=53367 RepID=A0A3D9ZDJ1_9ACTN|nr:DNA-binding SARP family transcriptional activator [Asanoa ferruginea]
MRSYPEAVIVQVLGTATVNASPPVRLERKAREALSVLTVFAPAAPTLDELARLLWDDPPPSAVKTLRAHLSRIRAALRAAGADPGIERVGRDGYRLAIDLAETDLGLVADARARARRLRADGRPDSAAAVLAEARARWRGDPELPDTTAAAALAQGWRRERRLLVQEHLACLVDGHDPAQAISELERLTAEDPLDEPLWVHYVRALHRAGRQNEALRAAAAARAALVEVGLDPTSALRDAQAEVFAPQAPPAPPAPPAPTAAAAVTIAYATGDDGATAYTRLSSSGRDLVVLNPAMLTIDGLLDEQHARSALAHLARHAAVSCFDRRGIGLSDPLDERRSPLDQWVADLRQVLDALAVDRADLFANFDTGLIALEFAARYPQRVRSLVLTQCYPTYLRTADYPYGLDPATTEGLIRDSVAPGDPARRIDTVAQAAPSVAGDEAFRSWWNRIGQRAAGPTVATAIRTVATRTDLRHRLAAVTAPTLVLHRRNCVNVDVGHARYLAEHLPDARLRLTAGTDALWLTDSTDQLDHAVEFLAEPRR